MKFTLSWLKDHLDTTASLDEISKALTAAGLEVESISNPAESLKAFTVAKIVSAEKHPEADKLQVCKVASDAGELQIVCGAPNARARLYVVLAKEGAFIPGSNFTIKKTKIRGVESNGMLCSLEELALPGDSAGIVELAEAPIGSSAAAALGADDPVIEIAITPNRADCLGVRGVARDLAAAGLGTLKALPDASSVVGSSPSPISVSIETANCQQFIGCHITGVKNAQSPAWMKKRLEAIGQKSISALVDITNYITNDLCRPLHVYDAKKLKGNLRVRDSKSGEELKALNGTAYGFSDIRILPTVIADDQGPVAIAGIIGGEPTGCTDATTDVFLEVALFTKEKVASDGRIYGINSDARYRFERGVDVAFVEEGAKQALRLITEICGGKPSALVTAGATPDFKRSILLGKDRIATLGGVDTSIEQAKTILTTLGFDCITTAAGLTVSPPSWRADVEGEADVVEEVLRIVGYDNIPALPLPKLANISRASLTLPQKRVATARRALAASGMTEACTWSFLPEAQAAAFGGANPKLKLLNPISADLDTMRPSVLPNLLEAAKKNAFRGFKDVSLFEVGLQFSDITPEGQRMVAGGIISGNITTHGYANAALQNTTRPADAFDAKTTAISVLQQLGVGKFDVTSNTPAWYHPGRSGALTLGGKIILGYFGEIHPALLPMFDLEGRVAAFEIFLDAIPTPRSKGKTKAALKVSDYQAVQRDFAFVVDSSVSVATITQAIAKAEKQLITDISIFDVYVGKGVEEGKKSVAVNVTLQAADRTLSDAEITGVSDAIVKAAASFGGTLRA